jgi:hypothetical protein
VRHLIDVTGTGDVPVTVTGFFKYYAGAVSPFLDYNFSISSPPPSDGGVGSFTLTPSNSEIFSPITSTNSLTISHLFPLPPVCCGGHGPTEGFDDLFIERLVHSIRTRPVAPYSLTVWRRVSHRALRCGPLVMWCTSAPVTTCRLGRFEAGFR